jgi:hypothetical protein
MRLMSTALPFVVDDHLEHEAHFDQHIRRDEHCTTGRLRPTIHPVSAGRRTGYSEVPFTTRL